MDSLISNLVRGAAYGSAGMPAVSSSSARAPAQRVRPHDIKMLQDRIDRLQLVCMAMWELLEEKTSLTSEELAAKVKELDLADGKADGKVSRTVKNCSKCGRAMSPRHQRCLYCGSAKLHENPFESA